jgi:XTP/dITP diphosphohydrolase
MKVLVLSPRVPAGLMSAAAWDAVRAARRVVAAEDGPLVAAIRDAGVSVEIGAAKPHDDVVWIPAPGDTAWARDWAADLLDGDVEIEVITGSYDAPGARLLDLVEVMDRLRRECAWTREQTHESLARYLVEETEETLEALRSGDHDHLREELGDLLMQVVFHSAVAAEAETWDIDDVAGGITEKLIRRNPHVFPSADGTVSDASTIDEIAEQWERIKAEERHDPLG